MKFESIGQKMDKGLSSAASRLSKEWHEHKPDLKAMGHKTKTTAFAGLSAMFGKIAEKSMDTAVKLAEKVEKPAETHEITKSDVEGLSDLFPAQ
jgi:hypothetical protein